MISTAETYKGWSDEALAAAIGQGKNGALEELYFRYQKRVQYFFYRMLGHSEEKANDFVQDLFLKLIEKPHLFNPEKRFSTWFFSVAHNMCKNEYRRLKVREVMDPEAEANPSTGQRFDPAHQADLNAFNAALHAALDQFDEDRKTAFLLRHREGFSIREISQVLQCAEGTVKSKLFYTHKKLAVRLKDFNPNQLTSETRKS